MISKEEVLKIAKLARIELTNEEVEKFQKDLSSVLDYFEVLKSANTEGVEPMLHSVTTENIAREDSVHRGDLENVAKLVEVAPQSEQGFVKVKEILVRES